jgi:hypothetical protein
MERNAGPNIAVIAVHGVADQQPFASAREIANLLVDDPHGGEPRYSTFVENEIRLAVDPIYPPTRSRVEENFWGDTAASAETDVSGYGHEFMCEMLSGRAPADPPQVYATVRLEGRRLEAASPATIHVYELFWADLSRVGSGVVRFFGELYQLLLHLPSLGKHAVSFAARENPTPVWKLYRTIERIAARLLSLVIPILNLILAALTSLILPRMVGPGIQAVLVCLIPALAAVALCALLMRDRELPVAVWIGAAPLAGAITWLAASSLVRRLDPDGLTVLAAEVWLLAIGVMLWILRSYERRQKRALTFGGALVALATVPLAYWWLLVEGTETKIAEVSLHMAATLLVVMMVVWFAWMFLVLSAGALGVIAPLTVPESSGRRKRAWRAAWTGQFALVFSGSVFAVVTIVLWSLLLRGLERWLPKGEFSVYVGPVEWMGVSKTLSRAPQSLMTTNVTWWFLIAMVALLLFLAAALWAVFPSIIAEMKPPATHPPDRSRASGIWLSRGLMLVGAAALLGTAAVALIFGLEVLARFGRSSAWWMDSGEIASALLSGASAILLLMIGTKQWMAGALSALDVILDVDNYMREHPRDSAPRAQIAERYTSLLRYLCRWRNAEGRGYDALVIVAHSQGTVITADLIRFLRIERRKADSSWEPGLEEILGEGESSSIPIYLFTMGSPLRQLYGLCFPHHYAWMDEDLPGHAALATEGAIPSDTPPNPKHLDLKRWVNAYRSGDYVGRTLWLSDEYENVWCQGLAVEDEARRRRERCIGRGAHTHYWDSTAAEIAAELHTLLGEAVQQG